MKRLKVNLFSGFSALKEGGPITQFGTAKVQALFAFLLVESERGHKREFLADLLWGEQEQENALHSLRQAVSALRKVLNSENNANDWLVTEGDEISLRFPDQVELDTALFEEGWKKGLPDGEHRLRPELLIQACALFRGPFMDQFSLREAQAFEEWAALKRELFNQQFVEMGEMLCDYYEQRGNYHAARHLARQMVEIFPWDEMVHFRLIKYLGLEEQFSAAEHQYQFCKKYLEKELAVQPSHDLETLVVSIRNRTLQKNHSPGQFGQVEHFGRLPIFGRDTDIARVTELLSQKSTRLVSLHGPGGIGKTRLAMELALNLQGIFRDGVFIISLNNISDQSQIAGLLAQSFNLVVSSRQDLATQVQDFLSQKEILLFLDNSETVSGFAGWVDDWLKTLPRVVICHSSRDRLNLQYEHVIPMSGLGYPEHGAAHEDASYPAVDFFLDVLARSGRNRDLPESELAAVYDICRKVEGLPLAIEMTAAQGWMMPLEDVNRTLDSQIERIESTYRNVPERHRTLIAVIDTTWSRLPANQQRAFVELGVFPADFDGRAAQEICGADHAILEALVQKSLVRVNLAGRYELHAVIRRYADFRLREDAAEYEDIQLRYLSYFQKALFNLSITPLSADLFERLQDMQADITNYLQAWNRSLAEGNEEDLLKMAEILYIFFSSLSRFRECVFLFNESRQKISADGYEKLDIRLAAYCGAVGHIIDSRVDVKELLQETRMRAQAADMRRDEVFCLIHLIATLKNKLPRSEVDQLAREAHTLATQIGDDWGAAYVSYLQGSLFQQTGECDQAIIQFNETLGIANRYDAPLIKMMASNALGDVYCHIGDLAEGRRMFTECLAISRKLGVHFQISIHLNNLGTIDQVEGNFETAIAYYKESMAECKLIGDQYGEAIALCNLGEVALLLDQIEQAEEYFVQAGEIGQRITDEYIRCVCLTNLADIQNRRGHREQALRLFTEAVLLSESAGMQVKLMTALVKGAVILHDHGMSAASHKFLSLVITHEATEEDIRREARNKLSRFFPNLPVDASATIPQVMEVIRGMAV